jgi:stromal membrane-associated protein
MADKKTSRDLVPEKVQETTFNEILSRQENRECADCKNKSPTWASIDFGVLLCIRCSGYHRNLGPTITRVRSTKLDTWERKNIDIIQNVNNKLANDYWEYKIPKSYKRLDNNASPEECKKFVNEKYIRKSYAPQGHIDPVKEYLEAVRNGTVVERKKEEPKPKEKLPEPKRKRSISLEREEKAKKAENKVTVPQKTFDLLGFEEPTPAPTNVKPTTNNTTGFGFDWNTPATTSTTTNPAPTNGKPDNSFDFFSFGQPTQAPSQTTNNASTPTKQNPEPTPETKKLDILSLYAPAPQPIIPNVGTGYNMNYNNFNPGMMYPGMNNGMNGGMNPGMNGGMNMGGGYGGMNPNPYGNMPMNGGYPQNMNNMGGGYNMNQGGSNQGGMMNNGGGMGYNMNAFPNNGFNGGQNGMNGGQSGFNNFGGGFNNMPTQGQVSSNSYQGMNFYGK